MGYQGKVKKRRKAPYPNSVLDRAALVASLDDAGINVAALHLDTFYQALHRQHYPPLDKFIENYYKIERNEDISDIENRPLKNRVSKWKSRNRRQLPKALLNFLEKTPDFVTITSRIQQHKLSSDNSTTKIIVELQDGQCVESVIMRYERKGSGRATLCVSSQVGCAMGCTFCATGTMGLSGNLTSAEILEQMVHANGILADEYQNKDDKSKKVDLIRNVVFMGMGEPLDNYRNVVTACRDMLDRRRWNLAHGRVTVSTVGLVSQIRKLTDELPEVCLALSLHAPNQQAREAIVPTASRYKIEDLVDALDNHMMAYLKKRVNKETFTQEERLKESGRRRAMIEYVMLEGDSSTLECAHQLGQLCEHRQLIVNLIPYNQTDVKDKLRCPSRDHMQQFRDIVCSYGTFCTIRRTMGADISGACGQLVKSNQSTESATTEATVDIEDIAGKNGETSAKDVVPTTESTKARKVTRGDTNVVSKANAMSAWVDSCSDADLQNMAGFLKWGAAIAGSAFIASVVLMRRR